MRVSVEEFKSFLQVVKESVTEQIADASTGSNGSLTYDFQFKVGLDPVMGVSSSELLSRLQALYEAVSKFSNSEFITWELAVPVTNTYTKYLQDKIQTKMQLKETLGAVAAANKLIVSK